jgi:hypothetical protein
MFEVEARLDEQYAIEANYFFHCLFGSEAPSTLVTQYARVHDELPEMSDFLSDKLGTINIIISRRLDAVSIEPWFRKTTIRHPLSAKLLLIAYLAETQGGRTEFSRQRIVGWLGLMKAIVGGVLSLMAGRYQIFRHGLV